MKLRLTDNKPLFFSMLILVGIAAIDVPMWINLFSWCLIILKVLAEKKNFPTLSRRFTAILSALLLGQIYLEFRTLLGQEPSTTLLLGLAALKMMDYETKRDHKYLVILGFMLLAMKPLFSLDLYWIPFLLCAFVGLWWSMLSRNQTQPLNFLSRLFLLSIPVALILFFIFPRVVFPWAHRAQQNRSQMGFSEQLSPGTAAELVETDQLVFRARFASQSHLFVESLYWRGGVLTVSQGLSWSASPLERQRSKNITTNLAEEALSYDLYLEPGNRNYVFALETPISLYSSELLIRDHTASIFRLPYPQNQTILFRGTSKLSQRDITPPSEEELQIPQLSSKVQNWVDSVSKKSMSDKVSALADFYQDNNFRYTLNPGKYGANDLEEFLFDRREGFCEHFAGSYATLARALGIPSRVVVGFHGGSWNTFGDFWRISTKDAHAWVEIFNQGEWQRVDPTAFAAPGRIQFGATEFFQNMSNNQGFIQTAILFYDQFMALVENVNYSWTSFLLDFDKDFQKDLMIVIKENLGWYLFALLILLIFILLVSRFLSKKSETIHPYQKLLLDVFSWAQSKGIYKEPAESPRQFLIRLSQDNNEMQSFSDNFIVQYEAIFYQNSDLAVDSRFYKQWNKIKRATKEPRK